MSARRSNFDSLRFCAALAVLWSHAFPLSDGSEKNEPFFKWSGGQTTIGTVAVACFFAISGFLITRSFEQTADPWRFARARVLRIMPGLLVVLIAVAFVLGPLISELPTRAYFRSEGPYYYVFSQASFWRFVDVLPGVFTSNPVPRVNGPLWTLRFEVECYVLVFLLGMAGLLRRNVLLALYVAALIYLAIQDQSRVSDGGTLPPYNPHLDLGSKFLAGALVYQWRVPLKTTGALLGAAVSLAALRWGHFAIAERTLIPYVVLVLALAPSLRLPDLAKWGDLSFGIYIYAWPIQQLVIQHSPTPDWLTTAAIATPIALMLAFLSWHGVEKIALSFKDGLRAAAPPSLQPTWPPH
ncbi:MAG TPA: acyltransferase [Polyangiaceae bacterium]|nr:acyltransferase [Polyangiaceae bacterium]